MTDHVEINRSYWNRIAPDWAERGAQAWVSAPSWGNWSAPEPELKLLPERMDGLTAIELGCGTGYVSAWMAQRGATVTGIDISEEQLATAQALEAKHGLGITFLHGDAERTEQPDEAFDFAISEYGAAIWCDPDRWLPEAHRILRPGGRLIFLGNHPLTIISTPLNGAPCEPVLHRPYRDLTGADWTEVEIDPAGIEFNRTISDWMALFDRIGFDVTAYHELYAPRENADDKFSVPGAWAQAFPAEQVWCLRKRG